MPERESFEVIDAHIDAGAAQQIVATLDPQAGARVRQCVYYPYYRFVVECSVASLFTKYDIVTQCLVDGSRGIAATTDPFETRTQSILVAEVLTTRVSDNEAERQARRFMSHALGRKSRSIADFSVKISGNGIVYKGFWLARSGTHSLIVDSVTGHLHTLRQAA